MSWLARLLAVFYQARCGGCGRWGEAWLCAGCRAAWPALPETSCPRCACPLGADGCPDCEIGEWAFEATYAAGLYRGVARKAISALKYRGARALAPLLATDVAARVPESAWLVVPVPIHRARRGTRGYNQAALLARAIARRRRWRYSDALRRRPSDPQQGLGRAARLANLDGAFSARRPLDGARVLLVDDVMTSGATAHHAAVALKRAGAAFVAVAVVARTAPDQAKE
ncbi:MAG TPA: ComF family protein [Oscillatoriaceae cyanobacterium]